MKIQHTAKLEIKHDTNVGDLRVALADAGVPELAKISVYHYEGDQRDPSHTQITFSWETGQ